MKKMMSLVFILLVGCTHNPVSISSSMVNDNSNSSSTSLNDIYTSDYAYIYDFDNDYSIDYFTSSNGLVSFSSLAEGDAEIGDYEYIDFDDYDITNLVAGDTISIIGEGGMTSTAIQGGFACIDKIHDIEYYPSTIHEVKLVKKVIDDDQIQIGFNNSLLDYLENNFVISQDEEETKDILEIE